MQSDLANPPTRPGAEASQAEPFRTPHSGFHIPELLAPAGDWDCARAAVENGADAIYFGLDRFNARMRAHNFTEAELPKLMEFLHRRGVKGYVAFNTLVFEDEMAQAEQYLLAMMTAGADAVIVQDVGVCCLIRRISPDFPIHVSTQMTVTSAAGVGFARELGCNLVVLARECSIKEIAKIREAIDGSAVEGREAGSAAGSFLSPLSSFPASIPLEVFVHGALCVAYSGQCLTSESLGGRSANRGECAQACRLPYDLIADGKHVPLGDRRYLLSPQDLAGLEVLPDLVRAGVASLKIEGRLKSPEYVANITRIYRNALDELSGEGVSSVECRGTATTAPLTRSSTFDTPAVRPLANTSHYDMEMAFSRGLYTGWLQGINNQRLVHARFGKKRGVYLGEVAGVRRDGVLVHLQGPLKPGDGVVFDSGKPEEREEGGRVYKVGQGTRLSSRETEKGTRHPAGMQEKRRAGGAPALLSFGPDAIDFNRIRLGDKLWKTSDPQLDRRLRQSYQADEPRFRRPLSMEVHGRAGGPLSVVARDEFGHVVRVSSETPLAPADKTPITIARLREHLGRLGGSPFKLGHFDNFLEGTVVLPLSQMNRLRRQAVDQMIALRAQPKRWTIKRGVQSAECRIQPGAAPAVTPRSAPGAPHLIVLVRDLAQLDAALQSGVEIVYCEFEDPKKYREAVSRFRGSALRTPHSSIFVAPPRIFKTGEE